MNIFEMIEEAKKSEYGATWFSEKGPIHISKNGELSPVKLSTLPNLMTIPKAPDYCEVEKELSESLEISIVKGANAFPKLREEI